MIITELGLEPGASGQEEASGWTVRGFWKRAFSVLLRALTRAAAPAFCPQ